MLEYGHKHTPPTTLPGPLTVTGTLTADDVTVTDDLTVVGDAQVGGVSTLAGLVTATTGLTAGGLVTASSGLAVGGVLHPATPTGAGQVAVSIYAGTGAPNNANGADGDVYLRSDGGLLTTIYHKEAGAWVGRA